MVIPACLFAVIEFSLRIGEQVAEPLLQRLDPSRRVAVLMALLGIIIIGVFFVAIVLLGGNWARRMARHSPGRKPIHGNGSSSRPRESPSASLPEANSEDTIQINQSSRQTRTDQ